MIPDDQIRREIAYLDEPDAYTMQEEFLAAVLVRSPERLREILEPCKTCQALEQELVRVESIVETQKRRNRRLCGALVISMVWAAALLAWGLSR